MKMFNVVVVVIVVVVVVIIYAVTTNFVTLSPNGRWSVLPSRMVMAETRQPVNDNADQYDYHVVFSTDCSEDHDFQSYVLFFHAERVQQPGTITRIASGCTPQQRKRVQQDFDSNIRSISTRFRIHFTPGYAKIDGDYFPYFNKPFGVKHWMEETFDYPKGYTTDNEDPPHTSGGPNSNAFSGGIHSKRKDRHSGESDNDRDRDKNTDRIAIILIDPDMIPLRPLTGVFNKDHDRLWKTPTVPPASHDENGRSDIGISIDTGTEPRVSRNDSSYYHQNSNYQGRRLRDGSPIAQQYLLGPIWFKWNLTGVVDRGSPVHKLSRKQATDSFMAGPPYMATGRDMWNIVQRWTELCIPVKRVYPNMLAEMYAYILAAADLDLPHQVSQSMMWSDARVQYSEPWRSVEDLPKDRMCDPSILQELSDKPSANFFHYCQPYSFNGYEIYKRAVGHTLLDCGHPLLEEPDGSLSAPSRYDYASIHPVLTRRKPEKQLEWADRVNQREAFATCQLIRLFNDAMEHYRRSVCTAQIEQTGQALQPNMEKTFRPPPTP